MRHAIAAAGCLAVVAALAPTSAVAAGPAPGRAMAIGSPHFAAPRQAGRAPTAPIATTPMTYGGGSPRGAILAPIAYLVFWGDWTSTASQVTTHNFTRNFFTDVGGTSWLHTVTQYCSGAVATAASCGTGTLPITNPALSFGGEWDDTSSPSWGANATETDVANALATEVQSSLSHFPGLVPTNAVIFVMPHGGAVPFGYRSTYCGFHTAFSSGGLIYQDSLLPYSSGDPYCWANFGSNPDSGYSIVGGHEYAEAITDPWPNVGWVNRDPALGGQGEIGDLCDGNHLADGTVTLSNGHSYPVQALFSNADLPSPCVFGTSLAQVPGAPTAVTAVAGIGSAIVSWAPPASIGSSAITLYTIASSGGAVVSVGAGVNTAKFTALATGAHTFTVTATNAAGVGPASSPSNTVYPLAGGTYHPQAPQRILDTRTGNGTGGDTHPVGPGGELTVLVAGRGGVPAAHVSAVVLNVTVTDASWFSYLTVYPTGIAPPLASNLNWAPGQTVANLVEIPLGTGGEVSIYNSQGSADVIFDVQGWVGDNFNSAGRDGLFNPLSPSRILDTRTGNGTGGSVGQLGPGQSLNLVVAGRGGVPASGVSAVVLNLTETSPTAGSYLTAYPAGVQPPLASNLNYGPGITRANRVMVALGNSGMITIYNSQGWVDVIVDVNGWFTDSTSLAGGSAFVGGTPNRVYDTRNTGGPLGDGGTLTLVDYGAAYSDIKAFVLNVTVTDTSWYSYLEVWPFAAPQPTASDINWAPGETNPNLVIVASGPSLAGGVAYAAFETYNSQGATDVIYDMVGYYGSAVAAPSLASPRFASGLSGN
ncbi:MAG TPA: fibronectin type III domain-containing protein [Candidatus Dormibacteraeota bacterium]